MALYAADQGPPYLDWAKVHEQPFRCLNQAIKPFRQDPDNVDQVLTAFALDIYKTAIFDSNSKEGHDVGAHAGRDAQWWFMHQPCWYPISEEVRDVFKKVDTSGLHAAIKESLDILDIAKICGDPRSHDLFEKEKTTLLLELKDWLLKCVCHPSVDPGGCLLSDMRKFIVPSPRVDRSKKSNYQLQRNERVQGGFGWWADLTRSLLALQPKEQAPWTEEDDTNILIAVKAYLRIALNVSFSHNHARKWSVPREEYILESERLHVCLVESPFSPYPLSVRQVLAESNYLGNWMLLEHMVLPGLDAPEDHWAYSTFRWIMRAATHTVADPTGNIKRILGKSFDLSCLSINSQLHREGYFYQIYVPGEVDSLKLRETIKKDDVEDEEASGIALAPSDSVRSIFEDRCHDPIRHPHWSLNISNGNIHYTIDDPLHDLLATDLLSTEAYWLKQHLRSLPLPQPDDECIICKEDFTTATCITTACDHLYHFHCLYEWQETLLAQGAVILTCCYCRRQLLDTDELKRLEEDDRRGVPMHLTSKQHEEEQRKLPVVTFGQLFQ